MSTATPTGAFAPSREERERMLASIDPMIRKLVADSRCPARDREDLLQECRLCAWQAIDRFDPGRGVKFSSYAHVALKRLLTRRVSAEASRSEIVPESPGWWDQIEAPPDAEDTDTGEPPDPDSDWGELFTGVRRALAEGLLDQLTDGLRRLVERVAFDGLTAAQVAAQDGIPVKVVRTNLKAALKTLGKLGLTRHVVDDAELARVTGPADAKSAEQQRRRREKTAARKAVRKANRLAAGASV